MEPTSVALSLAEAAAAKFEAAYKPRMEAAAAALVSEPGCAMEKAVSRAAQIEIVNVVQMFLQLADNTALARTTLANWPNVRKAFVETFDSCYEDYVKYLEETPNMHGSEATMGPRPI